MIVHYGIFKDGMAYYRKGFFPKDKNDVSEPIPLKLPEEIGKYLAKIEFYCRNNNECVEFAIGMDDRKGCTYVVAVRHSHEKIPFKRSEACKRLNTRMKVALEGKYRKPIPWIFKY